MIFWVCQVLLIWIGGRPEDEQEIRIKFLLHCEEVKL